MAASIQLTGTRVLVTGSTGLVGRAVARVLGARGAEVAGLARRATDPLPGTVEQIAIDLGADDAAEQAAEATAPCAAIVHAAASIDVDGPAMARTNCAGVHAVVDLAKRWGARRLVFISSVPVIGVPRELPVTEDHPIDPRTPYHTSKLYGELVVERAAADGVAGISLRLTAPVGPGMPAGRILPAFVRAALAGEPLRVAGEGTRRQDYVHVDDVADAVALAVGSAARGRVNVAAGRAISNLDLARLCVSELASSSTVERHGEDPADGEAWEVSIGRARDELGYEPRRSVADAIREVAAAAAES